jgi:DNA-directed RNA polymerase subunit M/transcription elongation factor TFIIS
LHDDEAVAIARGIRTATKRRSSMKKFAVITSLPIDAETMSEAIDKATEQGITNQIAFLELNDQGKVVGHIAQDSFEEVLTAWAKTEVDPNCPVCGSRNVLYNEAIGMETETETTTWQPAGCKDCGTRWQCEYTLTTKDNVEIGEAEEA